MKESLYSMLEPMDLYSGEGAIKGWTFVSVIDRAYFGEPYFEGLCPQFTIF